jgi:hypothetical protein
LIINLVILKYRIVLLLFCVIISASTSKLFMLQFQTKNLVIYNFVTIFVIHLLKRVVRVLFQTLLNISSSLWIITSFSWLLLINVLSFLWFIRALMSIYAFATLIINITKILSKLFITHRIITYIKHIFSKILIYIFFTHIILICSVLGITLIQFCACLKIYRVSLKHTITFFFLIQCF